MISWLKALIVLMVILSHQVLAVECKVLFPPTNPTDTSGPAYPFGRIGNIGTVDIKSNVLCNGTTCTAGAIKNIAEARIPTIPNGGSSLGELNQPKIYDQSYNYFTNWRFNRKKVAFDDTSGTAVIYIQSSGDDVILPENTELNISGDPENVLLVIETDKKVEIGEGSRLNAFVYIVADDEIKINPNVTINGAITVDTPKLTLETGGRFNFDLSDLDKFKPHEFCDSPPELIFHLKFDEGNGQTTSDASSYNRVVTLGNSGSVDSQDPTWQCEASGNLMSFDNSSNQHLETESFTPPAIGTVAFWMRVPELPTSRQRLFGFGDGWEARWESSDRRIYWDINKTGSNGSIRTNNGVTDVNQWIHFAATTNATSGDWSVYKNGVLDRSGNETLVAQSSAALFIGGSEWRPTSEHYNGDLEDFRIYTGVLSASEIAALAMTEPMDCLNCNVADNFTSVAYNQNDGSKNWSGDWQEVAEADGPSAGIARVRSDNCSSGNCLRLGVPSGNSAQTYSNIGVLREVNLNGATSATLNFNYRTGYAAGTPSVNLSVSNDGGSTWTQLQNYPFSSTSFTAIQESFDLTPYIASNTQIRFLADGSNAISGFYVDDLEIAYDCNASDQVYRIAHDGSGLTCLAEPVNIIACTDVACTATDTSVNSSINLLVTDFSTSSVVSTIAVPITNGVGSTSFNYANIGSANRAVLSSSEDYLCENTTNPGTTGQDDVICGVTYSDTAFVFSTIDNQIAGEGFDGIELQALQANEDGLCSALITDTTDIELAMQYQAPITTTSNVYTIGTGGSAVDIQKFSGATPSSFSPTVSLTFDATGKAVLPTNFYHDAGQIALHANLAIAATAETPAFNVRGNSNNFWVRPYNLSISATNAGGALDGSTYNSSEIHPAGDSFSLTITAVNKGNATATNYIPSNLALKLQRTGPTTVGVDGTLSYSGSGSLLTALTPNFVSATGVNFSGGQYSYSANYSEVGLINLDVQDSNYGNQSSGNELVVPGGTYDGTTLGDDIDIGRFTPAYFDQTVSEHGTLTGLFGNWAYSGQLDGTGDGAIEYDTLPVLKIEAKNRAGTITQNYTNASANDNEKYLHLQNEDPVAQPLEQDVDITAPTQDTKNGASLTKLLLTVAEINNPAASDALSPYQEESPGVILYTLSDTDNFTYEHSDNSLIPPFQPDFTLVVNSVTDADNVTTSSTEDVTLDGSTMGVRFGRLTLDNSFGPETSNLPQAFSVEYLLSANNFIVNTQDSCGVDCTTIEFATNEVTLSNISLNPLLSGVTVETGGVTLGKFTGLDLFAPGAGNQGQMGVEYETPNWLKFAWDSDDDGGDGNLQDDNAKAVATFGRYRGNDRIIYWQEIDN